MASIPLTVFTSTFNRSELLSRTYESLCLQTFRDFEWLIIDDGSSDDTAERVRGWQATAPFSIRYIYQRNAGKHRTHNRAIALASGELSAVLDSDDTLVPQAIERLLFHWNSIPGPDRDRFSGITCLCMDERCELVGSTFPSQVVDCRHYELETIHGVTGEKWGCHRTSVLRQFEFPEIPGEKYCPEGIVWNRIARSYLMRHVNEPLRIYYRHSGSMTAWPAGTLMNNPRYARLYYRECLDLPAGSSWRYKRTINYVRYSLHAGVPLWDALSDAPGLLLTVAAAPVAFARYLCDVWQRKDSAVPKNPMGRPLTGDRSAF